MSYKIGVHPEPGAEFPGECICSERFAPSVSPFSHDTQYVRPGNLGDVLLSIHSITPDLQQCAEIVDYPVKVYIIPDIEQDNVTTADLPQYVCWGRGYDDVILSGLEVWGHVGTVHHYLYRPVLFPYHPFNLC